ncbi:MAG: DUF4041 domain-containing protein [Acutalibacteraceae bacterium]|nr:DUF4041 domain-containing protein [Acutalibacteraceae bacterium]
MAKCNRCGNGGLFQKLNANGLCSECELAEMRRQLSELASPDYQNLELLRSKIFQAQSELAQVSQWVMDKKMEYNSVHSAVQQKRNELILLDDELLLQSFGLYTPKFDFVTVEKYKLALDQVREQQKYMIKSQTAVTGLQTWQVNGNAAQGKKMVSDMQKLLLRAFNTECDELVAKVKYSNLEASVKRIQTSCDAISKLGQIMQISISPAYMNLKIQEIYIAFEYAQAKQKDKEEQKELRARMREEAKLQKELEAERQKLIKEQTHYANMIAKLKMQLATDPNNTAAQAKLAEYEVQYAETEKGIADVDYRVANQKAGYVYVISNIGSFGEGVYKIGMTRRLDPTERVDELGDASVPFNFDIHALIFSEDAPALEAALHKAFESKKLNLVNHRREFFNVTLDEIKAEVKKNHDKTVEFIDIAEAEQFRVSQKMRNNI